MEEEGGFLRVVLRFLRSPRLTVALFLLLGILLLLGLLIPQRSLLDTGGLFEKWQQRSPFVVGILEWLGLTDIYTSPLVLGAWGLFFLNLVLVMSDRAGVLWRKVGLPEPGRFPLPSGMRWRLATSG